MAQGHDRSRAPRVTAQLDEELAWLDLVLRRGLERQQVDGLYQGDDDLRGIYVSPTLAGAALAARSRARLGVGVEGDQDEVARVRAALDGQPDRTGLRAVWERFAIGPLARLATLLAVAPEVDPRYQPVLAYLNDDAGRRRATVGLALELFAGPGVMRAADRAVFGPDGALTRYRLVEPLEGPLLDAILVADEWLVGVALGAPAPDGRLQGRAVRRQRDAGVPALQLPVGVVVAVLGDDAVAVAEAAADRGPAVAVDVAGAEDPACLARLAARQARADGSGLVISGGPWADPAFVALLDAVAGDGIPVRVTARPDEPAALPARWGVVAVPAVTASDRGKRWRQALAAQRVDVSDADVASVAGAFPMPLGSIDAAACRLAAGRGPGAPPAARAELAGASRSVCRHSLAALARRVPAGRTWGDLVLPRATLLQLREIAGAVAHRSQVLDTWGFGARPGGRGVHVLFAGASGTGKTLAASVIAAEAGYELYAVDLARVVDKYLGETEKALDQVLREAESARAMLLFDEADALFGRRGEVREARDRYANLEVAYLLQRLEAHDGVTVLATNLGNQLDEAFARRLHHRVDFLLPDPSLRRRLWETTQPPALPRAADLDFDVVAERFELSGGAIRNAALNAAYLAAADGGQVTMEHVVRAVARELEKAGRAATRAEFGDLHALLP
jgi:hypothetical protein